MISANINLAAVLLLLCSAGINARMLQQAATQTPTPTPTPSIDDPNSNPTPTPTSSDGRGNIKPDSMPPGSDRDEHGCIPSAGESWCESTKKCIRPWNTPCPVETPAMPGSDRDEHGCIPSAGESWCESTKKCIRPWNTPCPVETPAMPGSDRDEHGCIPSAGESWCESTKECIRAWNTPCPVETPAMPGSDRDEHGCISSAGETWCESTQECIQSESNTPCPAESDDQYLCPSSNDNAIAGGWAEATDAQADSSVNAAANFVLQSLGQENEAYTVDFACTQVVAGTNFYMVVSLGNGGKFTATVYQQLPASNGGDGSYKITSLNFEN